MKKILVTVPNEGWVRKELAQVLMNLMIDDRYSLTFRLPQARPLENNLHEIINAFVEGDWDYWLSIDADTIPKSNPLDLVELDLDIVGCPTPIWKYGGKGVRPIQWNAYKFDPTDELFYDQYGKGLQRVDAVGGGCLLVARRVFLDKSMQEGAFARFTRPDGTVRYGNDLSFCIRAKERGWKIWAHFDYTCEHWKECPLNDIASAMVGFLNHGKEATARGT